MVCSRAAAPASSDWLAGAATGCAVLVTDALRARGWTASRRHGGIDRNRRLWRPLRFWPGRPARRARARRPGVY